MLNFLLSGELLELSNDKYSLRKRFPENFLVFPPPDFSGDMCLTPRESTTKGL